MQQDIRYAHPLEALEELGLVLDDLRAGLVPHGLSRFVWIGRRRITVRCDWPFGVWRGVVFVGLAQDVPLPQTKANEEVNCLRSGRTTCFALASNGMQLRYLASTSYVAS